MEIRTQDGQVMLIILNGKGLKSSLPYVTTPLVVQMIPTHVSGHQPLHPPTQITISMGPEHEMKMVGHQAVADQSDWNLFVSLLHQRHEGSVVVIVMKNISPPVAPIEHVINESPLRCSRCSSHAKNLQRTDQPVKETAISKTGTGSVLGACPRFRYRNRQCTQVDGHATAQRCRRFSIRHQTPL